MRGEVRWSEQKWGKVKKSILIEVLSRKINVLSRKKFLEKFYLENFFYKNFSGRDK